MADEKRIKFVTNKQKQRNRLLSRAMRQAETLDLRPEERDAFGGAALLAALAEEEESE
jgi:hypothetical protein